jgi:hypothetical protein
LIWVYVQDWHITHPMAGCAGIAHKTTVTASVCDERSTSILGEWPELTDLILEGGGDLAVIWQKQAARRQIAVQTISAEQWRADLLLDREQRRGLQAKDKADRLARRGDRVVGCTTPNLVASRCRRSHPGRPMGGLETGLAG